MPPLPRELKVVILRACIIKGQDASPGETWVVGRVDAAVLVGDGLARLADPKTTYSVTVETPEHGDPSPRRISAPPSELAEKAGAKKT